MKKLKLIEEFETAVREHAFRGAAHPEDRASIEKDYQEMKHKLEEALRRKKDAPMPSSHVNRLLKAIEEMREEVRVQRSYDIKGGERS